MMLSVCVFPMCSTNKKIIQKKINIFSNNQCEFYTFSKTLFYITEYFNSLLKCTRQDKKSEYSEKVMLWNMKKKKKN